MWNFVGKLTSKDTVPKDSPVILNDRRDLPEISRGMEIFKELMKI
jgi:hypothetical protein